MKIVIAGIGGVGGYFGGLLARYYRNDPQVQVYFFARGNNMDRIRENGLTVIHGKEQFTAIPVLAANNAEEIGPADLVICTAKSYDLEQMIQQLQPCISENTILLPLLNGVDITDRIRALLPHNEVLYGCTYIVARLKAPGIIENSGNIQTLYFGSDNGKQPVLTEIEHILQRSGIEAFLSDQIRRIIWEKFIFISATATLTSYYDSCFAELVSNNERKQMLVALIHEILLVAEASGIRIDGDISDSIIRRLETLPDKTTSSMHSDFLMGKKTELSSLTGIVVQLGEKYHIKTPCYDRIYSVLRSREIES